MNIITRNEEKKLLKDLLAGDVFKTSEHTFFLVTDQEQNVCGTRAILCVNLYGGDGYYWDEEKVVTVAHGSFVEE